MEMKTYMGVSTFIVSNLITCCVPCNTDLFTAIQLFFVAAVTLFWSTAVEKSKWSADNDKKNIGNKIMIVKSLKGDLLQGSK